MNGVIVKVWADGDTVQCCSSICRPEMCHRFDECETVILIKREYAKGGTKVEEVD